MVVGRRRSEPEPDPGPGHGSGISIGGSNIAPLQNVVGQNISHVHQSASVTGAPVNLETVRDFLTQFRTEVDRNEAGLANAQILRAMTDSIDTSLRASDAQAVGALRGVVQALPALVAGTAVQQGGEALAHAIAGWLG
ncbi:hypothetical protein C3489_09290 [Streptomyces sp. Ru71]|uniref:hypothetical protein n=1 Tax=Streptomyces sp. Ru71 TaxID=2080746 RepID=UPI000CDD6C44|nr:hypothetical protein [Streptomyces sp. Ru71]POX55766.1 hypothetical protein C3489_09290 [Streptomyces sp. Ru71]